MKFKASITISDKKKPYEVYLAIPDMNGKFLVHIYAFSKLRDANFMILAYLGEFDDRPDTILEFHMRTKEKFESQLDLPFSG
jgi:hypothetical protein